MSKFIFGPVRSRRLGLSLGVDILPHKTCSMDCVYCECGRTTALTGRRKSFFRPEKILAGLKQALKRKGAKELDYITFSGAGEPTLNSDLGRLITAVKKMTSVPVAVLTNASLIGRADVRRELSKADLVVPSLDAATPARFARVNRPVPGVSPAAVSKGLVSFRRAFRGLLYLEVLLVKGYNDSTAEVRKIARLARKIRPDRVDLGTCVRPGTEKDIKPVSEARLRKLASLFSPPAVLPGESQAAAKKGGSITADSVLRTISRRPSTLRDLAGRSNSDIRRAHAALAELKKSGYKVIEQTVAGKTYYSVPKKA